MSILKIRTIKSDNFPLLISILISLCLYPSISTAKSGIYCIVSKTTKSAFASRIDADGNLLFGLSVWSRRGSHIGVFGVALRNGKIWQFERDLSGKRAEDRCKIKIRFRSDYVFVSSDPNATCERLGGYGSKIGDLKFGIRNYEGNVIDQLDDSETFFSKAGRCLR